MTENLIDDEEKYTVPTYHRIARDAIGPLLFRSSLITMYTRIYTMY